MTDKPSCETCPRFYLVTDEKGGERCPLGYSYEALKIVPRIGCLSHPQAREYLMGPVIKELERRVSIVVKAPDEFAQGYKNSVDELKSLIMNGVGGK